MFGRRRRRSRREAHEWAPTEWELFQREINDRIGSLISECTWAVFSVLYKIALIVFSLIFFPVLGLWIWLNERCD